MPSLPPVKRFLSNTGVKIYRIPCQVFDNLSARVYLLLNAGLPTLVDAGSGLGHSTRQILDGLEAVRVDFGENVRPADIRCILISHGHIDHVRGLPELMRHTPHAQVAIHPLDRETVASRREHNILGAARLNGFLRQAGVDPAGRATLIEASPFHGVPVEDVAVGLTLEDGDQLDGLRILHTPGHSPGHVCVGVGNVLLSGDHILSQTLPQQWPESTAAYTGLSHYLESLDKVFRTPGFELTLASHEQVIHDVYGRIETIRAAHRRRLERLLDLLRRAGRPLSTAEIAEQSYPEVTGFRAVLAFTDVGARVEYLHQRGNIHVANLDDVAKNDETVCRYEVA